VFNSISKKELKSTFVLSYIAISPESVRRVGGEIDLHFDCESEAPHIIQQHLKERARFFTDTLFHMQGPHEQLSGMSEDEDYDETGLTEALYEKTTGVFATGGRMEGCPLPGLFVEGVGPIALPLQPDQARSLVERQVEPSRIRVSEAWDEHVQRLARVHAARLGVGGTGVKARLYKLVLYEEGGFFKSHKDTEKEPGMFGSLVVQLPARHDLGALVVRHRGEEALFDFGGDDSDAYFYSVAFYADCEHELRPVENGKRLCLLYNLVRGGGGGQTPSLAHRDAMCDRLLERHMRGISTGTDAAALGVPRS
jgi:hypothetical protein